MRVCDSLLVYNFALTALNSQEDAWEKRSETI